MEALAPWHGALIVVAALVLFFGWKQLPNMARSAGRSLRIFKSETRELSADKRRVEATLRDAGRQTRDALRDSSPTRLLTR